MTTTESDFDSSPVQQDANSRISVDESPLETNFQFIGKNIPYGVYFCPGIWFWFFSNSKISVDKSTLETNFQFIGKHLL